MNEEAYCNFKVIAKNMDTTQDEFADMPALMDDNAEEEKIVQERFRSQEAYLHYLVERYGDIITEKY